MKIPIIMKIPVNYSCKSRKIVRYHSDVSASEYRRVRSSIEFFGTIPSYHADLLWPYRICHANLTYFDCLCMSWHIFLCPVVTNTWVLVITDSAFDSWFDWPCVAIWFRNTLSCSWPPRFIQFFAHHHLDTNYSRIFRHFDFTFRRFRHVYSSRSINIQFL